MSEKLNSPGSSENYKPLEAAAEHHEKVLPQPESTVDPHEESRKIEHARQIAEHEAGKTESVLIDKNEKQQPAPGPAYVGRELKELAYHRLINRAQKGLNPVQRPFSRFMHQPVVEKTSEMAARTVGRPSGIIGGGAIALAGSTAYYYLTKHYGYNYNFSVFIILLAGGFTAGWILELLWKVLRKKKAR